MDAMRYLKGTVVLTLALGVVAGAMAQTRYAGPDIGVFYPTDSTLRDALGNAWYSVGLTTMRQGTIQSKAIGTNLNFISQTKNGNKVFMASYTLGLFQPLSGPENKVRPFFAARAGLSYIDYALNTDPATRVSAKRIGYNANVEFGFQVSDRLTLAARYDVFSKYDGLSFDGLSLSLKYGIVKF